MTEEAPGRFSYELRPLRVVLESGAIEGLGRELSREGIRRPLLLTTPGRADDLPVPLAEPEVKWAGTFPRARTHVSREVVAQARSLADEVRADGLVSYGGGAAMGTAKGVALETQLPIVAIPTTLSGSETTAIWGVREGEGKVTGRTDAVAPRVILYDPELLKTLPPRIAGASGVNALAHGIGVLIAPAATALARLLAREGVARLVDALPRMAQGHRPAREEALWGAHLTGRALDMTPMGLHHRLCHILGGHLDLSHAMTHAVLLPFTTMVSLEHAPGARATLLAILGKGRGYAGGEPPASPTAPGTAPAPPAGARTNQTIARALLELNQKLDLPLSLQKVLAEGGKELSGSPEALVAQVTEVALGTEGGYRIKATGPEISGLLDAAWEGALPGG